MPRGWQRPSRCATPLMQTRRGGWSCTWQRSWARPSASESSCKTHGCSPPSNSPHSPPPAPLVLLPPHRGLATGVQVIEKIDQETARGQSPAELAYSQGHTEAAGLLLKAGATGVWQRGCEVQLPRRCKLTAMHLLVTALQCVLLLTALTVLSHSDVMNQLHQVLLPEHRLALLRSTGLVVMTAVVMPLSMESGGPLSVAALAMSTQSFQLLVLFKAWGEEWQWKVLAPSTSVRWCNRNNALALISMLAAASQSLAFCVLPFTQLPEIYWPEGFEPHKFFSLIIGVVPPDFFPSTLFVTFMPMLALPLLTGYIFTCTIVANVPELQRHMPMVQATFFRCVPARGACRLPLCCAAHPCTRPPSHWLTGPGRSHWWRHCSPSSLALWEPSA